MQLLQRMKVNNDKKFFVMTGTVFCSVWFPKQVDKVCLNYLSVPICCCCSDLGESTFVSVLNMI